MNVFNMQGAQDEKVFLLEIRFPAGNRYPQQPCLVSLSTPLSRFPREACMKITARLMEESKQAAADSSPAVFSLVGVLEDRKLLEKVISGPTSKLSLPRAMGVDSVVDNDVEETNGASGALMKALEKPARRKENYRMQRSKMLEINRKLIHKYQQQRADGERFKLQSVRESLPAWKERKKIISLLRESQVLVISGMTGCGKSTQVPQFVLDDWLEGSSSAELCNIICTQPRRISAVGLASRVSAERDEKVGEVVGYQIRMETKLSDRTRLQFCTTGILLRRLETDPTLEDVTHVVVDEVHERSEDSDFLLMILRDTLVLRPDLKLILMSATVNADLFSGYFNDCPVLEIPGRTFPVQQVFLEEILETIPYSLEANSPYARRQEKSQGSYGGLDKNVFKGNKDIMLDAYFDKDDADMLLRGGEGSNYAKDKKRDEQLEKKQVYLRYEEWSERTANTLSLMDWEKINYDLVEAVLAFIAVGGDKQHSLPASGSILVFLPGMQVFFFVFITSFGCTDQDIHSFSFYVQEIMTLYEQLDKHPLLGKRKGRFLLVPLHSSLSSEEQQLVFSKPKAGLRKIVISTNLAETSITIDDCVFVVDVGKMKEKRFDATKNMESLDTVWVSQANALQRKGRAGRVMEGFCFHLYTGFRYDNHMRADPVPEIQRVPLEKMILRIKILSAFEKWKVKKVFSKILEPPSLDGIDSALQRLKNVGALYPDNSLTPLGYHLAQLPVDVRIGKLMLYGAVFRCLDAALTIAASLSYRSPFLSPFKEREAADKARMRFQEGNSDQLTVWRAYRAWAAAAEHGQQAGWVFSQENFLSQKTLQMISQMKHQFVVRNSYAFICSLFLFMLQELLASIGFIPGSPQCRQLDRAARGKGGADAVAAVTGEAINANNGNTRVVASVLCAALYPNIIKVLTPEVKYKQTAAGAMFKPPSVEDMKFKTQEDGYVNLHPSSVTSKILKFDTPYLVYHEKIKTSRVFVREVSMVPMYPMVLFGGSSEGFEVQMNRNEFVISLENGWIKFICEKHLIAELLKVRYDEPDCGNA